jgi:hypothetical protein
MIHFFSLLDPLGAPQLQRPPEQFLSLPTNQVFSPRPTNTPKVSNTIATAA